MAARRDMMKDGGWRRGAAGKIGHGKKDERAELKLMKMLDDKALIEYTQQMLNKDVEDDAQAADAAEAAGSPPGQRKRDARQRADAKNQKSSPVVKDEHAKGENAQTHQQQEKKRMIARWMNATGNPARQQAGREQQDKMKLIETKGKRIKQLNKQLEEIAEITQENAIINDARYTASVRALKRELDHALLQRLDGGELMSKLRADNRSIQDKITRLKGAAARQAQEEKEVLEEAFRKQIDAKQDELRRERDSGKNKTDEWVAKNRKRQQELDQMLQMTETKHVVHRKLEQRNKALRVEFNAQKDDKEMLLQESQAEKNKNQRLKDRIHELESQITEMQAQAQGATGGSGRAEMEGLSMASLRDAREDSGQSRAQKLSKYEDALQRHRALLAAEVKNVQGVRAAHLAALSQRTELEVHLIEAILARQDEIAARVAREQQQAAERGAAPNLQTGPAGAAPQAAPGAAARQLQTKVFTAADRRRVIEDLLSKEKVLYLLYQQDQGSLGDAAGAAAREDRGPTLELDMNTLWEKWKGWTEAARARPAQPPPQQQQPHDDGMPA